MSSLSVAPKTIWNMFLVAAMWVRDESLTVQHPNKSSVRCPALSGSTRFYFSKLHPETVPPEPPSLTPLLCVWTALCMTVGPITLFCFWSLWENLLCTSTVSPTITEALAAVCGEQLSWDTVAAVLWLIILLLSRHMKICQKKRNPLLEDLKCKQE